MKCAAKFKFHSIIRGVIVLVAWVVFFIFLSMTNTNGQPKNSRYNAAAWQRLPVGITAQNRQIPGYDQNNTNKGVPIRGGVVEFRPVFAYNQIYNNGKPSAEPEKLDARALKSPVSQARSQQHNVRTANKNKQFILAGILVVVVILFLLLQLYRTKLNFNRSFQAQQLELDQRDIRMNALSKNQQTLRTEKEWLIKEVQHRVKNNLQIVMSLLYSQSIYLEDSAAIMAIKDSLRRIQAMSLIHQKLYRDTNTTTVSMPEYINDLVLYLHESFDADNHIVFEQDIAPVDLDMSQVLPLGLIFTESIVNAIKYAFLKGQQGTVRVYLGHDGPGHLLLKISDNGIGLPPGIDTMEHHSLGLDLIQGLSKQLKGSFQIESNNGVHITVRFAVQSRPALNMNS
jgi:two-component sensor histidine kinase